MKGPRTLAVDTQGYVLVADGGNNRILKLNPKLSQARHLPLPMTPNGPTGILLEMSIDRLYVGEYCIPHRIFVFDTIFIIQQI
jgi:streptogramin lyase